MCNNKPNSDTRTGLTSLTDARTHARTHARTSPVCGLRPARAWRVIWLNVPNPVRTTLDGWMGAGGSQPENKMHSHASAPAIRVFAKQLPAAPSYPPLIS